MKNNNCGATFKLRNQLGRQVSRNAARRLPGKAGLSNLPYTSPRLFPSYDSDDGSCSCGRRHSDALLSTATSSFAGSATWLASPATGNWNTAGNWTAGGPPDGSADTATFALLLKPASPSRPSVGQRHRVQRGASELTISASGGTLTISGAGITTNSGNMQNFVDTFTGCRGGVISFTNSATAGSLTAFTSDFGEIDFAEQRDRGSECHLYRQLRYAQFFDTSTAGKWPPSLTALGQHGKRRFTQYPAQFDCAWQRRYLSPITRHGTPCQPSAKRRQHTSFCATVRPRTMAPSLNNGAAVTGGGRSAAIHAILPTVRPLGNGSFGSTTAARSAARAQRLHAVLRCPSRDGHFTGRRTRRGQLALGGPVFDGFARPCRQCDPDRQRRSARSALDSALLSIPLAARRAWRFSAAAPATPPTVPRHQLSQRSGRDDRLDRRAVALCSSEPITSPWAATT